jgi:hypothetical protein
MTPTSRKTLSLTTQIRLAIGFYGLVCMALIVAYVGHDPIAFAHGDRALPIVLVVAALSCGGLRRHEGEARQPSASSRRSECDGG